MQFHEYRLKEDWLGSDSSSMEATMNLKALAQPERDTQGTQTDRNRPVRQIATYTLSCAPGTWIGSELPRLGVLRKSFRRFSLTILALSATSLRTSRALFWKFREIGERG